MEFIVRMSILFLAASAQLAVGFVSPFEWSTPNIVLVIVLAWVFVRGLDTVGLWVVFAGILTDLLLFERVGESVLLFSVAAFGANILSRRYIAEHPFWSMISAFVVIFFITTLSVWVKYLLLGEEFRRAFLLDISHGIYDIFAVSFVTGLLYIGTYFVLRSIERRMFGYQRNNL